MTFERYFEEAIRRPDETVGGFEKAFARFNGRAHALATTSGTAALHLALLTLGVGAGDGVVLPSYVCAALLNAVNYTGASPVFADAGEDGNVTAAAVRKACAARVRIKAVIVPHMFGRNAAIEEIVALGKPVVEDFTFTVGSGHGGKLSGCFGVIGVASFYRTKVLSTQQGGIFVTDDRRLMTKARHLTVYDKKERYAISYACRMNGITAALGLTALEQLPERNGKRKTAAGWYRAALRKNGEILLPPESDDHIYARFVVRGSVRVRNRLLKQGVNALAPVFRPLHRYGRMPDSAFPVTVRLHRESFCLPLYPETTREEVERVVAMLEKSG